MFCGQLLRGLLRSHLRSSPQNKRRIKPLNYKVVPSPAITENAEAKQQLDLGLEKSRV